MTLSLKFILSVNPVKKRGTYEDGEGQPADFISKEHGIPLSKLMVGRPASHSTMLGEKRYSMSTQIEQVSGNSPNLRAIKEPVGTMGSVRTASKPYRETV